jgi:sortase (surface protein transpeptidase)
MPPSMPVRVKVPRVGIDAQIIQVGIARNGAVGVPSINDALKAGWYDKGPTPGENGPAVIDAHVDSVSLPTRHAAFFALGAVRPGDRVEVSRADRTVAEFSVDSVEVVRKRDFPTAKVYGPTTYAGLRLITCGGEFVRRDGYLDNIVVFAHLTGSHRGPSAPGAADD